MKKTIISIASDFSVFPGGRTPEDGEFSGQDFRDRVLIPSLENFDIVEIDFDGTRGYGSSFLEETFGGLIRKGFTKQYIDKKIHFKSSRKSVIEEVNQYIEKASGEKS